jgi:hypothetical protein
MTWGRPGMLGDPQVIDLPNQPETHAEQSSGPVIG